MHVLIVFPEIVLIVLIVLNGVDVTLVGVAIEVHTKVKVDTVACFASLSLFSRVNGPM